MMKAPSEAIKDLYTAVDQMRESLDPVVEHLDAIESAEERRANTNAVLSSINRDHDMASKRLASVKSELARVEGELTSKVNLVNDEKARTLRDTQERISDAQNQLDLINVQINARQREHDAIIASMESL